MNVESTYYDTPSTSGQSECPRITSTSNHKRASSNIRNKIISDSSIPSHTLKDDTTISSRRSLPRMRDSIRHLHGTGLQLLAGGLAGAVSKTCTAPLSRLTILFQIQGMHNVSGKVLKSPSIYEETKRIVREEGIRAFWKGNTVTILHRLPYSAINFYAFENYKAFLSDLSGKSEKDNLLLSMGIKLIAGGSAGVTAASITYPLDLVRTRLAAQTRSRYYNGVYATLRTIVRDEGLKGLYKGMGATLLGVGPNLAINFCVYETLRNRLVLKRPDTHPAVISLASGSLAGLCSSTATFPLDLVRRRMQLEGAGGFKSSNRGISGMFSHIIRTEGLSALYRGIIPEYAKVVPGVSIAFMTYEFIKKMI